jgi:hypothetical protein
VADAAWPLTTAAIEFMLADRPGCRTVAAVLAVMLPVGNVPARGSDISSAAVSRAVLV